MIPNCRTLLAIPCYQRLEDIVGEIDIVQAYPDTGLDLLTLALQAIRKKAKCFWVEDQEAPEPVRKVLSDAEVYLVELESLEREYKKNCRPLAESLPRKPVFTFRVNELMTRNPVTVKPTETISAALAKMKQGQFHHLPVVDDNDRLIGMFSDRDLRLIYPSSAFQPYEQIIEQLNAITVKQAAVFTPVAILYDAPLEEAARMMLTWHIGALPVISRDSCLVGIITYSDLLQEFLDSRSITLKHQPVKSTQEKLATSLFD